MKTTERPNSFIVAYDWAILNFDFLRDIYKLLHKNIEIVPYMFFLNNPDLEDTKMSRY